MSNCDISSTRPTWSSKAQRAWQQVKDGTTNALSSSHPWKVVTIAALMAGTITAAVGFGGIFGGLIISVLSALPFRQDLVEVGTLNMIICVLLVQVPAFCAVATVVLAGVALVGMGGMLTSYLIRICRRHRRLGQLSEKAREFYHEVEKNPQQLSTLNKQILTEHDLISEEDIKFFLFSSNSLCKNVQLFDATTGANGANNTATYADELFDEFDGSRFPNIKFIKCSEDWLKKNASKLAKHGRLVGGEVDGTVLGKSELNEKLGEYNWQNRVDRLPQKALEFYNRILEDPDIIKDLNAKTLAENGFCKFEDVGFLLQQFREEVETFQAGYGEAEAAAMDRKTLEFFTKFNGELFPKLKRLRAKNVAFASIRGLEICRSLQTIEMINCQNINWKSIQKDLAHIQSLTDINFTNCNLTISDLDMMTFKTTHPNLKTVIVTELKK